jgi:hypothetical protein
MPLAPESHGSFARLTPWQARAVLIALGVFTLGSIAITLSPLRSGYADAPGRGPGDLALYRAEVERMRSGEGYYQAAHVELRERGYPTRSLLNWRTPLPMWLIAVLPHRQMGWCLLGALAVASVLYSFAMLADESNIWQGVGCGALMVGALFPCAIDHLYVAPELWAATLITLSLAAYSRQRTLLAVALGIGALFFRDIAAPYCLVMTSLALWQWRRRELAAWCVAYAAYALFFGIHALNVLQFVTPADRAHDGSWVQFGGLPFVLSTCQMNVFLLLLPQWITAIYIAMAMLGLASWKSENGLRVGMTLSVYVALMSVVGHSFNQYWGSLFAPLLCFGVARFPSAVTRLWRAAKLDSAFAAGRYSATTDCSDSGASSASS